MMRDKVEKMIETMDKVVEKTLHLVTPDSLKYMRWCCGNGSVICQSSTKSKAAAS